MSAPTKVDPSSPEFLAELEKTVAFTDKVIAQFGYVYNPDPEINKGIQFGLTRNKLIYNKRYCPCFFVTGNKEEDRICPCKPGLHDEIPKDGHCHCAIFCTQEYSDGVVRSEITEAVAHKHTRTLTKDECDLLFSKGDIDADELISLIAARDEGVCKFSLVDVREKMEYDSGRIKGVDFLIPTTTFYDSVKQIADKKEEPVVLYCQVGSRSDYCKRILQNLNFEKPINLAYGISGYHGEIVKGK